MAPQPGAGGSRPAGKNARRLSTTDSGHGQPVAPNLLAYQLEVAEANGVWCADIVRHEAPLNRIRVR